MDCDKDSDLIMNGWESGLGMLCLRRQCPNRQFPNIAVTVMAYFNPESVRIHSVVIPLNVELYGRSCYDQIVVTRDQLRSMLRRVYTTPHSTPNVDPEAETDHE